MTPTVSIKQIENAIKAEIQKDYSFRVNFGPRAVRGEALKRLQVMRGIAALHPFNRPIQRS